MLARTVASCRGRARLAFEFPLRVLATSTSSTGWRLQHFAERAQVCFKSLAAGAGKNSAAFSSFLHPSNSAQTAHRHGSRGPPARRYSDAAPPDDVFRATLSLLQRPQLSQSSDSSGRAGISHVPRRRCLVPCRPSTVKVPGANWGEGSKIPATPTAPARRPPPTLPFRPTPIPAVSNIQVEVRRQDKRDRKRGLLPTAARSQRT